MPSFMSNFNDFLFGNYSLTTGKSLANSGIKLYKVLNEAHIHRGMHYKYGKNVDRLPFNPTGECSEGGIYFTTAYGVLSFSGYGIWLREVTLDPDEQVYIEDDKFKAHTVHLGPKLDLFSVKTLQMLEEQGNFKASEHCHILTYFLHAAQNGKLGVLKYMLEQNSNLLNEYTESTLGEVITSTRVCAYLVNKCGNEMLKNLLYGAIRYDNEAIINWAKSGKYKEAVDSALSEYLEGLSQYNNIFYFKPLIRHGAKFSSTEAAAKMLTKICRPTYETLFMLLAEHAMDDKMRNEVVTIMLHNLFEATLVDKMFIAENIMRLMDMGAVPDIKENVAKRVIKDIYSNSTYNEYFIPTVESSIIRLADKLEPLVKKED